MNVPKLRFKEFNDEWIETKIQNVATVIGGGTPSTDEPKYWGNEINWFTPSEIGKTKYVTISNRKISQDGLKNSSAKLLPKGTILLSSRATVGEASILLNEASTNQGFQSLIVNENNCNEFIYYLKYKYKREMLIKSFGSTFLEISKSNVENIKIKIPSKEEQFMIANFLSLLDKKIELQSKKIEDLKLFKKGLLQKQYNYIKDKNLVELSYIANIYQPQTISQNKLDNGKYFVFGANGIIGKYSRYNHKQKQITISCRGENSGKVNITPEKCWITGNSMVLNTDNNYNVDKIYLKCVLDSQNLRYLISGSGQPQITRNVILKHKIPLLPILEQKKFRNPFIKLDLKIHLEETKVNKLLDIKKGLMQDMFV